MFNVGLSELLVFGIIALLVLGPEKLPEAARFAGKWYAKIMHFVRNAQNDIDRELRLSELRDQIQQEMARMSELEEKMQASLIELQQQASLSEIKKDPIQKSKLGRQIKKICCPINIESTKGYQSISTFKYFQTYLNSQNKQFDLKKIATQPSPPIELKVIA